jgi:hypothetical protein
MDSGAFETLQETVLTNAHSVKRSYDTCGVDRTVTT